MNYTTVMYFLYLVFMPKKPTKSIKKLAAKEKPLKLNMTFEEAIKKALNTPIKNSKVNKK